MVYGKQKYQDLEGVLRYRVRVNEWFKTITDPMQSLQL